MQSDQGWNSDIIPPAFRKGNAKTEEEWAVKIQKQMDYSMERIQRAMGRGMRTYGGLLYVSIYHFSSNSNLDMVGCLGSCVHTKTIRYFP